MVTLRQDFLDVQLIQGILGFNSFDLVLISYSLSSIWILTDVVVAQKVDFESIVLSASVIIRLRMHSYSLLWDVPRQTTNEMRLKISIDVHKQIALHMLPDFSD